MLRRLLESWLDSASERSYQVPFCQILSAQGHTILHSTRHGPLEFGKDIITIGPDRVPCAYQLKGNPGTRLTLDQYRKIEAQLVQLVNQPILIPGGKSQPHRTYLVTNGHIDEEAQVAVNNLNAGFITNKAFGKPIEIIQRGQLLNWAFDLGTALWPSELKDANRLLQLLVTEGDEIFPSHLLHDLLLPLLFLNTGSKAVSANELKRHITSAAILTAVSLRNFGLKKNHFAEISAWVMFCAYAMGTCERHNKSFAKNGGDAVDIACESIFLSLSRLCDELLERRHYVEGNTLVDSIVYKGRFTLLNALMAIYWFWCDERGWPNDRQQPFVEKFITRKLGDLYLWGEGVVPQLLACLWYLRGTDATMKPDANLFSTLRQIIQISADENSEGLPGPYYSFEDVIRHNLRGFLALKEDPFRGDSFRKTSFYALSLMHLLVRTNLKQHCKAIWPDLSRLNFRHFSTASKWMYCLRESPEGNEIAVQPQLTKTWEDLVTEARDAKGDGIPAALKANKFLFMLFLILFPYRGTPPAIRYLGSQFNGCWSILPPII